MERLLVELDSLQDYSRAFCTQKGHRRAEEVLSAVEACLGDWYGVPPAQWPFEVWTALANDYGGIYFIDASGSDSSARRKLRAFSESLIPTIEDSYVLEAMFDPWVVVSDLVPVMVANAGVVPAAYAADFGGGGYPPIVGLPAVGGVVAWPALPPAVLSGAGGAQYLWVFAAHDEADRFSAYIRATHGVQAVCLRSTAGAVNFVHF